MPNYVNSVPVGPYSADQSDIARRQRLAQLLQQQSLAPIENQQSGMFAAPISPFQVAAKALGGYQSWQLNRQAEEKQRQLSEDMMSRRTADTSMLVNALRGQPATPAGPSEDAAGNVTQMPGQAAQTPVQTLGQAIPMMGPEMQPIALNAMMGERQREQEHTFKAGESAQDRALKEKEAAENRAARKDAADAARLDRASRDAATRQAHEDSVRLTASLKPLPAPSMTEVIDPKDPTRLLRVDARAYKGGSLGDAGVLGISGKEPTAQKKAETVDAGRDTVSGLVTQLRDYYGQLEKAGGISNPDKGLVSNLAAGAASSGVGQAIGRFAGTQNQSARNSIAQQRPLLLMAIKNATGMTAKQMDSNAELKLWLSVATDPGLDIKSNKHALDMIEQLYGNSGGNKGRRATDKGPNVDDLLKKYGNP